MSKERLEVIKEVYDIQAMQTLSDRETVPFNLNDVRWLVEQSERVQELEDKLESVMDRHTYLEGDYYSLQQQNKRYQDMLVKIFKIVQNHQIMKISDEDYADAATFIYKWIYDTGAIDPVKHFSEVRGHDEFDSHQINLLLKKHIDKESSKPLEGEE